ncbi:MAG: peptidase, partial [Rhodospirillaceae bacterium]|nr:peptidase [Rhodospirillaceae bacterium]
MLLWALSLVFPVVMILSMLSDLRTFEIPNRLPLALVVGYPLAALSAGLSWQPQLWAFALGGLMLVIAVIMFVLGLMGGG